MPRSINRMSRRTRKSLLGVTFALLAIFAAGCSEEEKKPAVSANLCLTLPNGLVLGPYDTDTECQTARENMPDGKCHICKNTEKKNE